MKKEKEKSFLKPNGQLVLETIVLDRAGKDVLVPDGRYAKMRNVWNIPTPTVLTSWMKQADQTVNDTWNGGLAFSLDDAAVGNGSTVGVTRATGSANWTLGLIAVP